MRYETDEATGAVKVLVTDDDENQDEFDAIIFACSAPSMLSALHGYPISA